MKIVKSLWFSAKKNPPRIADRDDFVSTSASGVAMA